MCVKEACVKTFKRHQIWQFIQIFIQKNIKTKHLFKKIKNISHRSNRGCSGLEPGWWRWARGGVHLGYVAKFNKTFMIKFSLSPECTPQCLQTGCSPHIIADLQPYSRLRLQQVFWACSSKSVFTNHHRSSPTLLQVLKWDRGVPVRCSGTSYSTADHSSCSSRCRLSPWSGLFASGCSLFLPRSPWLTGRCGCRSGHLP